MIAVRNGIYRHYKKDWPLYRVLIVGATDSETLEEVVVYQSLTGGKVWTRPQKMFEEELEFEGDKVHRFHLVGEIKDV